MRLAKELSFFKDECMELRRELGDVEDELAGERKKNEAMLMEREDIKSKLVKKEKKLVKYRAKTNSLNKTIFNEK